MTEAQQQTIDRVFELLSEHFDHAVIAVGAYDEDKQYTTAASFTGGVAAAIGLCKLYEAKWTKEHLWGPDDDEDEMR
jgi:ATP phosphoribosyltransferase regulatory subunit HisZ